MIRLNIKLHKDTLAAYEELETNMKQEREKQLGAINYVSGFWEGQAAKTFQTCYTTMLTEGSYQEVLEQVTGMRTIMEDILPSLKALKWKCDNFDACLSGGKSTGSIFEQYQSTMFLEDVLMLEESIIPRIDSYSDGIMSDINQLENALQDVMQACGGLVNFGDEPSSLKTACNKVRRIQILRNEIDDYAKKVIDLDSDLEVSYKAWENAENIDEIEQMKALTEEEKAAVSQLNIFLTVLSWKYDEQEYENIAQLLQTDENGIFEFEKVLQKETLTDEEIEALAHLYEEAYEQIRRTEDCQLSADIVQCYTEKLFYFEEDTKGINQYYVSTKDSLLQSILDKIDTGNEAAIYSLENLKGTKLEVKKSWFESNWKEFGSSVTELKDFKDSTDMVDVALVKTDLGIQTVLYAYPSAGKREEHADEGYKVIYEKELYELPLLDRCARSGYIMTREEEKQVEKEIKGYFSIDENKFARDIALNFGPDMVSQSTKVDFTPEEYEKFQQMYLLYRKTSDKDAFSYGFYSNFLLTKPFTYGGIVDRLMGYPDNGSHEREYLEMAAEQNSGSYMIGSIAGGGASYAVGSAAMKKVPGVGKLLTKAGEKLSKVPIIGKFGAESLTNILADTTLDTAIDTIPSMVEVAMDGGSAGEVALEGLKRTGISLGANGAFEAVFKVGKGVLGGTVEGDIELETRQLAIDKFYTIRETWIDDIKADEFINTLDNYAKKNVDIGACKSKTEFYQMYFERCYRYSDEFIEKIKKPYLETGASSIINEKDIENAFSRFETIGRAEHGNFTTSVLEDSNLLHDASGNIVDKEMIETIKGVDPGKYATGVYQYIYDVEMVKSIEELGMIRVVDGVTPGASAVNIPGSHTWAGYNISYSESELIMPSIDVSKYDSVDVFKSIESIGFFEIKNPTVICPDGSKIQINGTFKIEKIGD